MKKICFTITMLLCMPRWQLAFLIIHLIMAETRELCKMNASRNWKVSERLLLKPTTIIWEISKPSKRESIFQLWLRTVKTLVSSYSQHPNSCLVKSVMCQKISSLIRLLLAIGQVPQEQKFQCLAPRDREFQSISK